MSVGSRSLFMPFSDVSDLSVASLVCIKTLSCVFYFNVLFFLVSCYLSWCVLFVLSVILLLKILGYERSGCAEFKLRFVTILRGLTTLGTLSSAFSITVRNPDRVWRSGVVLNETRGTVGLFDLGWVDARFCNYANLFSWLVFIIFWQRLSVPSSAVSLRFLLMPFTIFSSFAGLLISCWCGYVRVDCFA